MILCGPHGAPHGLQLTSRIADGEFRSARRCPAIVFADASGTKELGGTDSPQVRARCVLMCPGEISHYSLQQKISVTGFETGSCSTRGCLGDGRLRADLEHLLPHMEMCGLGHDKAALSLGSVSLLEVSLMRGEERTALCVVAVPGWLVQSYPADLWLPLKPRASCVGFVALLGDVQA